MLSVPPAAPGTAARQPVLFRGRVRGAAQCVRGQRVLQPRQPARPARERAHQAGRHVRRLAGRRPRAGEQEDVTSLFKSYTESAKRGARILGMGCDVAGAL